MLNSQKISLPENTENDKLITENTTQSLIKKSEKLNIQFDEKEHVLSTINRNPRSWITAIVGAEYIFKLLPKGTHEFDKFIKPSELASYVRNANAHLIESKGMFYNPISHQANLNNDLGVNFMMYAKKV